MSPESMFAFLAVLQQYGVFAITSSPQTLALAEKTLPRTVLFDTTPTSSSISPAVTLTKPCADFSGLCYDCRLYANDIGLNSWYSSHYTQTYAIVTQTVIQYNDAVVTADAETIIVPGASSLLGHYDADAPPPNAVGLPTDLVPGNSENLGYGYSYLDTATVFSIGGMEPTGIASPTAWTQGTGTITAAFTVYTDGIFLSESTADLTTNDAYNSTFVQAASVANPIYSGTVVADMPQSMYQDIVSYWKTIPGTNWSLESCTQHNSMGGEPTVHVAVSQLTVTSSTTSTIDRNAPVHSPNADQTPESDALPTAQTSNSPYSVTASMASPTAPKATSAGSMVRHLNGASSFVLVATVCVCLALM